MNLKTITIALSVLVFAVLATVIMQKGSYVSQAQTHYEKKTGGWTRKKDTYGKKVDTRRYLW